MYDKYVNQLRTQLIQEAFTIVARINVKLMFKYESGNR